MTKQELGTQYVIDILKKSCDGVVKEKGKIRELDAQWGDGDLGITVEKGFNSLKSKISEMEDQDPSIGKILRDGGLAFNNAASSTFGALFASACMEAGKKVKDRKEIDLEGLRDIFEGAVQGVKKRGGAEVGDKTMLDALVPAKKELDSAMEENESIPDGLQKAAKAAENGAKETEGMEPKQGRGKQVGDKAKEVQDPGATVISLLLKEISTHTEEVLGDS